MTSPRPHDPQLTAAGGDRLPRLDSQQAFLETSLHTAPTEPLPEKRSGVFRRLGGLLHRKR